MNQQSQSIKVTSGEFGSTGAWITAGSPPTIIAELSSLSKPAGELGLIARKIAKMLNESAEADLDVKILAGLEIRFDARNLPPVSGPSGIEFFQFTMTALPAVAKIVTPIPSSPPSFPPPLVYLPPINGRYYRCTTKQFRELEFLYKHLWVQTKALAAHERMSAKQPQNRSQITSDRDYFAPLAVARCYQKKPGHYPSNRRKRREPYWISPSWGVFRLPELHEVYRLYHLAKTPSKDPIHAFTTMEVAYIQKTFADLATRLVKSDITRLRKILRNLKGNEMGICWYCYWGWAKPVAELFVEAIADFHGDDMPLLCGPGHIVFEDENFRDQDVDFCIAECEKEHQYKSLFSSEDLGKVKKWLLKLREIPESIRCCEPKDYDEENPENFPPAAETVKLKDLINK